jgi:hypothetical protein
LAGSLSYNARAKLDVESQTRIDFFSEHNGIKNIRVPSLVPGSYEKSMPGKIDSFYFINNNLQSSRIET